MFWYKGICVVIIMFLYKAICVVIIMFLYKGLSLNCIVDEFADEMGCDCVLHADTMRACWGCVFSGEGG